MTYFWVPPGKSPVPCAIVGLATSVPEPMMTIRIADPFDPGQLQKEVRYSEVYKLVPLSELQQVLGKTVCCGGGCGGGCGGCSGCGG